MHAELDALSAVLRERPDLECMQGRRARTRVDLGLDVLEAEFRQADPLAPAEDLFLALHAPDYAYIRIKAGNSIADAAFARYGPIG
jgi:hypothetical protein